MAKTPRKKGPARAGTAKYDAHHKVLSQTYGALADLRRELADSKAAVAERTEILNAFAQCQDSQRAWLLLEDYFEKLNLARKDFQQSDWWLRLMNSQGTERLEETALLFLRSHRPLPNELIPYANFDRFAKIEQQESEQAFAEDLENWLFPRRRDHLDAPRAALHVFCHPQTNPDYPNLHDLEIQLGLVRPRTGEKIKTIQEIIDLTNRSAHEQELFPPEDWEFMEWLAELYKEAEKKPECILLQGVQLLQWLARWGHPPRFEHSSTRSRLEFHGEMAELDPRLWLPSPDQKEFGFEIQFQNGNRVPLHETVFFAGTPGIALHNHRFYLIRNAPAPALLDRCLANPSMPVEKLSHRLLTRLRNQFASIDPVWQEICIAHTAQPQFIFEMEDEAVRLRLLAKSEKDRSLWQWNGHEWQPANEEWQPGDKPEILDDPRLEAATQWLRRLDWFTPEPGLWVGDANEHFLNLLSEAWIHRPAEAEYLGNHAFHRLFLSPRRLKPQLVVTGSGIDWFSVSADWEIEGMKLTQADLEQLQTATGRFVKLPDTGWVELDRDSVQEAHETFADLGLDGLVPVSHRIDMAQGQQLGESAWAKFENNQTVRELREKLKDFSGTPPTPLPSSLQAELRPYQKEGFDFLCNLVKLQLGGILADDMGLGKTLQTLAWISWLKEKQQSANGNKPSLVICPASVLHNWRRETHRFTPNLSVLVLESGSARHNLRGKIPQHDIIVTNYALLRRDLTWLKKFEFQAVVLDEAQFIKNPSAQITSSVKQLRARHRLALTGTPMENRLLDLWSITDFIQPGYLGGQEDFISKYEVKNGEEAQQRISRRRLSAKLAPILLRRIKTQVARDLPERIEERRDCQLGDGQKKLYLAELRRSREKVMQSVAQEGLGKSRIHVLAALTRLRQICCHPKLVGNDSRSGKTETLFELLEPLLEDGQKVLVFSQFVQMLELLTGECRKREIRTHILTGETKNRQEVVQNFQDETHPSIFLLSLRAAGTGLNLTTASYVILYDPWWNPAVEAQAIDRSHRIGQTRTVNAYRLITPGTVEEKIWELQQRKSQTISDVLGEEGFTRSLSQSDLDYLFSEE